MDSRQTDGQKQTFMKEEQTNSGSWIVRLTVAMVNRLTVDQGYRDTAEWEGRRTDGWTDGWMDRRMDGPTDGCTHGRTDDRSNEVCVKDMDRQTVRLMEIWTDGTDARISQMD